MSTNDANDANDVKPEVSADATGQRTIAMIVAASENDVIGNDGDMPWQLSADLKRFKKLTMGHTIIMGRKTYDSIGRLLPGRTTVILTRQTDYSVEGAIVVHSLENALAAAKDDTTQFIVGGSEIYRLALPMVSVLHLTRVHASIEGDTRLPEIDWSQWEQQAVQRFEADERNSHPYSFCDYFRR